MPAFIISMLVVGGLSGSPTVTNTPPSASSNDIAINAVATEIDGVRAVYCERIAAGARPLRDDARVHLLATMKLNGQEKTEGYGFIFDELVLECGRGPSSSRGSSEPPQKTPD